MKFFHMADLHLGKTVNGFSMLQEQRHALKQVLQAVEREKPEAVLLAGDVYDRPIPSGEAVSLFNWFLTELAALKTPCLAVAGNHDSGVRLEFAGELLKSREIYLVGTVTEQLQHVRFQRDGVVAEVWMLPFLRPAEAAFLFPDESIKSYEEAVRVVLSRQTLQPDACNLLLAHQFVTRAEAEPERSDSETVTVGGLDRIDSVVFDDFDYVALGHLHSPQQAGVHCRYAGSLLQYSFSEVHQKKGICVVEIRSEKQISVSYIPLHPCHLLREIRGALHELIQPEIVDQGDSEDYLHVTLTDELEPENANARLRAVYPNLMKLDFDNSRTRQEAFFCTGEEQEKPSLESLFAAFYERQNGRELDALDRELLQNVLETVGDEMP